MFNMLNLNPETLKVIADSFVVVAIFAIGALLTFGWTKYKPVVDEEVDELQEYARDWDYLYKKPHSCKSKACMICGRPISDDAWICYKCQNENN